MKIYHGSRHRLSVLNKQLARKNNEYEYYGDAIYFSNNIDIARAYGKNIWCLNLSNLNNFSTIDAKGNVIRNYEKRIKSLISKQKNVIVKNVLDNPRGGVMYKYISFNEWKNKKVLKEYPYFISLISYELFHNSGYQTLTKSIEQKFFKAKEIFKNRCEIIYSEGYNFKKKKKEKQIALRFFNREKLIEKDYEKFNKIGFKVDAELCTLPKQSNTYIILNDFLLSKAKLIK